MKVGAFNAPFAGNMSLDATLSYFATLGLQAIEIGTGNYPPGNHCHPGKLLERPDDLDLFLASIKEHGLVLSALSCHGNPLHPSKKTANAHHEVFVDTVALAKKIRERDDWDVVVNGFSGLPAGGPKDKTPNWVVAPWPEDHLAALEYQWNEVAIPYWRHAHQLLCDAGVDFCIEMHPNMLVYTPDSLMRLRQECGSRICANFDPSHLWWQGINVPGAVRWFNDADGYGGNVIRHCHGKDCKVYDSVLARKGVLDTLHYGDEINRAWIFRTVGYGHGEEVWRDVISTLRMCGYDGVISLEHEDSLMSSKEGFEKGVAFLDELVLKQDKGAMTWA